MPRTRPPYPTEYRERILELHRNGRSIASLARDFEPSAWTIGQWVRQDQRSRNGAADKPEQLSEDERSELRRLRRENEQLKVEREILEKAAAWFAQKTVPKSRSGS